MVKSKLDEILENVELISTKWLTGDLINGYSILKGVKYFSEDGSQNYFKFKPLLKYFEASRTIVNVKVMAWKSKGLSDKSIKTPATSDNSLSPTLD